MIDSTRQWQGAGPAIRPRLQRENLRAESLHIGDKPMERHHLAPIGALPPYDAHLRIACR